MDKLKVEIGVPDWVRWIAQDADGKWHGYNIEPKNTECGDEWTNYTEKCRWKFLYASMKTKNWKQELYEWK